MDTITTTDMWASLCLQQQQQPQLCGQFNVHYRVNHRGMLGSAILPQKIECGEIMRLKKS